MRAAISLPWSYRAGDEAGPAVPCVVAWVHNTVSRANTKERWQPGSGETALQKRQRLRQENTTDRNNEVSK
jgi:hypothetical protein